MMNDDIKAAKLLSELRISRENFEKLIKKFKSGEKTLSELVEEANTIILDYNDKKYPYKLGELSKDAQIKYGYAYCQELRLWNEQEGQFINIKNKKSTRRNFIDDIFLKVLI